MIGDWGDNSPIGWIRQQNVADIMELWCADKPCDFVMSTGDNFYPDGAESVDDRKFDNRWRDVYNGSSINDLPWLISLGNHDHNNDNEVYQLAFAETEPRWELPWLWHKTEIQDGDFNILLYAIDTDALRNDKYSPAEQLADLERALNSSDADWKIVYGHHPPLSVGRRWGDSTIFNQVVPLLEKYDVDALICGHDHNMQHIVRTESLDIEYVVSGAGGRGKYEYDPENGDTVKELGYEPLFFSDNYGFAGVTINGHTMRVMYYTYNTSEGEEVTLRPMYSFTRHHAHEHL